jgi:hypothetical protein
VAEDIPETPDKAVQGFIGLIALGFACGSGDVMLQGQILLGIFGFVVAAIFSWIVYQWPVLKPKASAHLLRSIDVVASDVRWWLGAIGIIVIALIFSPFVEQRRWPFSAPLQIVQGPVESVSGLPALTIERQRALVSAFSYLKPQLPTVTIGMPTANGSRAWILELQRIFERAGILANLVGQNPRGPEETGLMIAARDPKALTDVAKRIFEAFEANGLRPKVVQLAPNIVGEFTIFVGPDPL